MNVIVTVNKLKLASELAHNATIDELKDLYTEEELWIDDNGTDVYIDEAQEVFNRWYDYYESIIDSCIVNDINDRIYNGEEHKKVLGSYGLNVDNFKKVGIQFKIPDDHYIYTIHKVEDDCIEITSEGELITYTTKEFEEIKKLNPIIIK